ncbi:MAG: MotA/TolQ/ExbB proton channel family protein [bacterium]|nr:MotA/TolQ/ExbB proton channel family protein [bacterium]
MGTGLASRVIQIVITCGGMAKGILIILLIFSIVCWALIIKKYNLSRRKIRRNRELLKFIGSRKKKMLASSNMNFNDSPLSAILTEGIKRTDKMKAMLKSSNAKIQMSNKTQSDLMPNIISSLQTVASEEIDNFENHLIILGTAGAVSPFIGLLGTVWGVMEAFLDIKTFGSAHIDIVAPGIAEALITTVAGLLVAIPALIAYNYFINVSKRLSSEMDRFITLVTSEIRNELSL